MTKFKDYDSLLNSYQQLEKKFTQKCQELAQHGTSQSAPTQNEPPQYSAEQFYQAYPQASRFSQQLSDIDSPNSTAESYMACYIDCLHNEQSSANSSVVEQQCVPNSALPHQPTSTLPPIIAGNNGNMSLAMPSRPKTISEASSMAKKIFE